MCQHVNLFGLKNFLSKKGDWKFLSSHQQYVGFPISPHPHQHLLSVFFIIAVLVDVKCYLIVFFINFILFIYFLYSRFLLIIYFIHISEYMSIPISQFIPPPPLHFPPLVSIRLFSTSVSLFLPCKLVHMHHFSRLLCFWFAYS